MAASSKSVRDEMLSQLLKCPICLDQLEEPRMLRCRHFFCLACLDETKQGQEFKCGVCRQVTKEKDVASVPIVTDILEVARAPLNTSPCTCMCANTSCGKVFKEEMGKELKKRREDKASREREYVMSFVRESLRHSRAMMTQAQQNMELFTEYNNFLLRHRYRVAQVPAVAVVRRGATERPETDEQYFVIRSSRD